MPQSKNSQQQQQQQQQQQFHLRTVMFRSEPLHTYIPSIDVKWLPELAIAACVMPIRICHLRQFSPNSIT
jgi:hypothetical protein